MKNKTEIDTKLEPLCQTNEQMDKLRKEEMIRIDMMSVFCRIYFDIAAEIIGEDEVRRRRDERIEQALKPKTSLLRKINLL